MPQSMWQDAKRLGTEQTTETTAEIQQKHPFSQTKFLEKMFFFVSEDSENQKDVFFCFRWQRKPMAVWQDRPRSNNRLKTDI